jgi:hypothetical protein
VDERFHGFSDLDLSLAHRGKPGSLNRNGHGGQAQPFDKALAVGIRARHDADFQSNCVDRRTCTPQKKPKINNFQPQLGF